MTISHFAASLASLVFASLASRVCASLASAVFASLASLVCASLCISAPDGSIALPLLHSERCFAPDWSRKCSSRDRWSPQGTPWQAQTLSKICDFKGPFLGPNLDPIMVRKHGAATSSSTVGACFLMCYVAVYLVS